MAITETVYLVTNGDLHKIGITQDFKRRMKQLKPDHVQARLDLDGSEGFTARDIELILHRKFKDVRIPQTEYFRLTDEQVLEACHTMKSFSNQRDVSLRNFLDRPSNDRTPNKGHLDPVKPSTPSLDAPPRKSLAEQALNALMVIGLLSILIWFLS